MASPGHCCPSPGPRRVQLLGVALPELVLSLPLLFEDPAQGLRFLLIRNSPFGFPLEKQPELEHRAAVATLGAVVCRQRVAPGCGASETPPHGWWVRPEFRGATFSGEHGESKACENRVFGQVKGGGNLVCKETSRNARLNFSCVSMGDKLDSLQYSSG